MSRADELRAALAVAELEDELVGLKESGDAQALEACKHALRYARWTHRGGPQQEADRLAAGEGHTNRVAAEMYLRWQAEKAEG